MTAAGKMTATTPVGIYAIALMVRSYRSEAGGKLSAALADAVIDNPAMRAILWPAGLPQLQAGD